MLQLRIFLISLREINYGHTHLLCTNVIYGKLHYRPGSPVISDCPLLIRIWILPPVLCQIWPISGQTCMIPAQIWMISGVPYKRRQAKYSIACCSEKHHTSSCTDADSTLFRQIPIWACSFPWYMPDHLNLDSAGSARGCKASAPWPLDFSTDFNVRYTSTALKFKL